MPISNEEPLPPAGEAAPTPASTPVDSLSEVNDQLESVKLSEPNAPADATVRDTNPKEDPELWKPHPPSEECPVCMVPLPLENNKSTFWPCCGKLICTACSEEHHRALKMTNRKREKKKQPPLDKACAFCRSPVPENDAEETSRLEKRIEKEDTRAMVNLGRCFRDGSDGVKKDDEKAIKLFQRAADLGSAEAIGQLGSWAAKGWLESTPDTTKAKEYLEDAAKKGDINSRYNLSHLLAEEGNFELAIKHWHLSAAAGDDDSMKPLWGCFSRGRLSKADLEKALRAHKAACDEMKSEERERYDAAKEAWAGNDELLRHTYGSYYFGYINAKELKKSLKAHAAGDWRAVETFLANKIRTNR